MKKYHLPEEVQVEVVKDDDGSYFAKLTDYPGCMTVADSEYELLFNLTDAILTYFEVPHKDTQNADIVYFPKVSPQQTTKKMKAKYFHLLASQKHYGEHSSIRTT